MRSDSPARNALSLAVPMVVFGISFGVLSVSAGFGLAQTCAMSLLAFTGASQFLYVSVLGAGGTVLSALAPALLLAARNGVYATSLGSVLAPHPWRRAAEAQLVIDESTAMAHAQGGAGAKRRAFLLTGLTVLAAWNLGTLVGAAVGSDLGDPRRLGLDAIFPAVFIALLAPQLRRGGAVGAALAGAAVALVLLPVAPVGVPVLAATLAALPALRR